MNLSGKLGVNYYMAGVQQHDNRLWCTLLTQKLISLGKSIGMHIHRAWLGNNFEGILLESGISTGLFLCKHLWTAIKGKVLVVAPDLDAMLSR